MKSKLVLAAVAVTLPIFAVSLPASAATTHNLQTGAKTSNSNDRMSAAPAGTMSGSMKMKRSKKHKKAM